MIKGAIGANICKGGGAPKKKAILGQNFPENAKNAFFACFFKIFLAAQKIWPEQGLFSAL